MKPIRKMKKGDVAVIRTKAEKYRAFVQLLTRPHGSRFTVANDKEGTLTITKTK